MPLIRRCRRCKQPFKTKPFFVKNGGGKYCSRLCAAEARRKGKWIKCYICGKDSYKQRRFVKKSQTGNFFCSKKCSIQWQNTEFVGEKHPNWKYGEHSYRDILRKYNIFQECVFCKVRQKEILLVHHLDQNRKNNTLKNLVWLCYNCHHLVHNYKVERGELSLLVNKKLKYINGKV